jgi:multidrug efflux system membrane fusion protein
VLATTPLPGGIDRRTLGRFLARAVVLGAVAVVALTIWRWTNNPRTDNATVRANFVGVAAEVSGRVVELHVADQQLVQQGDLLLVVDERPYEIAVERARAALALTETEVLALKDAAVAAGANVAHAEAQRAAAEADTRRAEAERVDATNHLERVEPLLAHRFVTADSVDKARTARDSSAAGANAARAKGKAAAAAVNQARAQQQQATNAIGQAEAGNARIDAALAALHQAELELSYCRVRASFPGRVVNLNISAGAYAHAGAELFTLVDSRVWWVVANYRETELKRIHTGAEAEVYLQSRPGRRYQGRVVGLGWAVLPENGTSVMGLPRVERALDWVRLAARFPVRIRIEDPDDAFRLGASAVVTVRGEGGGPSVAAAP